MSNDIKAIVLGTQGPAGPAGPAWARTDTVAVADATARKSAATYTAAGVTPSLGMLVIQDDMADVHWELLDLDVTLDASWRGVPVTDASGQLVGPIQLSGLTAAESAALVPAEGEVIALAAEAFTHLGQSHFHQGGLQVGDGTSTAAALPAMGAARPKRYAFLTGSATLAIEGRFDYIIFMEAATQANLAFSGTFQLGQRIIVYASGAAGCAVRPNVSRFHNLGDSAPIPSGAYPIIAAKGSIDFEIIPRIDSARSGSFAAFIHNLYNLSTWGI